MEKRSLSGCNTGSNYYTAESNPRGYEWSVKEADNLLRTIDLIDANQQGRRTIGQISFTKLDLSVEQTTKIDIDCNSDMYNVYDGQQRMVTLMILLAALCDILFELRSPTCLGPEVFFQHNADTEMFRCMSAIATPGDKKATVKVPRLVIAESETLTSILTGAATEKNTLLEPPHKKARTESSSEAGDDQRVWNVYLFFRSWFLKIESMEERMKKACSIGKKIMTQVCVTRLLYSNEEDALQPVVDQCFGKAINPIDHYRLVLSRSKVDSKEDRQKTGVAFKALCKDIKRNGSGVVQDACLAVAQFFTALDRDILLDKRVIRCKEVTYVTTIFSKTANDNLGGHDFFNKYILPVAKILDAFRRKELSVTPRLQRTWQFLQHATQIERCKELEGVIVVAYHFLKNDEDDDDLCFILLTCLEPIMLWFMLVQPTPGDRADRCIKIMENFEMIAASGRLSRDHASIKANLELTSEEKERTRSKLQSNAPVGFGNALLPGKPSSSVQYKVEKAILDRLNIANPILAATRADTEFRLVLSVPTNPIEGAASSSQVAAASLLVAGSGGSNHKAEESAEPWSTRLRSGGSNQMDADDWSSDDI